MTVDSELEEIDEPVWEIRTLVDAYKDRPPTEYIVDKFFATHTLNIVYGAPGVMKSLLVADMCCAIVAGQDWLPGSEEAGKGIPVKKSPIFWLDMDNGTRRTDERFNALAKHRGLLDSDPLYYISMPNPPYDAGDLDANVRLMQVIRGTESAVIVVDNLGLVTGDVEENSARMAFIMGQMRTVAERTGAAVVLIHHQRKGGAQMGRAGDALRGHSSIEASLDLALHIIREPNSREVTIRSTKTRGVDVPTVTAVFDFEHRSGTNDLELAWFHGKKVIRGDNPIRDAIVDILSERPTITKGLLVSEVHSKLHQEYGIQKIRDWIGEMVAVTEELTEEVGERGAKILSLNDGQIPPF